MRKYVKYLKVHLSFFECGPCGRGTKMENYKLICYKLKSLIILALRWVIEWIEHDYYHKFDFFQQSLSRIRRTESSYY